jgi:D-beta-D-heptose 7-phosphate kinase / D-beta-D-heptose 1-phosphate adenosyltransferase
MKNPRTDKYVYCAGVFDLLHYGHTDYLKYCKSLGDVLYVGLVDNNGVARYKPSQPIMSYAERYRVIEAVKYVDHIVQQNDTDPTETLKILKQMYGITFDIMVRGDDFNGTPPGTEFIEANGGKVVRSPYCSEISTTEIKKRINANFSI